MKQLKLAQFTGAKSQRGIALYVALIMLLLMTLLGLAALQVSTMQERMAGNFNTLNLAFQSAEGQVRAMEYEVQRTVLSTGFFPDNCAMADIQVWADGREPGDGNSGCALEVSVGATESLVDLNTPENEVFKNYRVVSAGVDRAVNESTVVIVETIFIPR